MKRELPVPPSFLRTVRLLLGAARRRAKGRRKRQQELMQQRSGGKAPSWEHLGFFLSILMMAGINVGAAFVVRTAVISGERAEAEHQGRFVVSQRFLAAAREAEAERLYQPIQPNRTFAFLNYTSEAERIAEEYGGEQDAIEKRLREEVEIHGTHNLISNAEAAPGFSDFPTRGRFPALMGSLALLWWAVMMVCQGEGLELDLQRRRHPMWEWLFSHPAPAGAIFLAEMLSPIAANPSYWCAPLFVGVLFGLIYGPGLGFAATLLVGIPVSMAAACLGKALEIGIVLRFPPRSRGAMIGLMSWVGYSSLMLFFVGIFVVPQIVNAIWRYLTVFTVLPWPWLNLFLGAQSDGSFSFLWGVAVCWTAAALATGGAIWFSVWGAQKGLTGNFAVADSRPSHSANSTARFGKEPLYRKEYLWFIRDRSAIVQTILIPLTVAGYQVFNLRGFLSHAQGAWNYLCGAGILFGTYFLWILGPKSLSSEGTALWISLTWPRGLESLLKAKAWLWSLISSGMVLLILGYAVFLYPASIWKIALVAIGWLFFSRSMAEKTVTLVTITSESGEPQKISRGRQWAAQLGMLTFSIGVFTQQWNLAVIGIVYSFITAAAMWENFRARLPYLYDPWSEKVPPPPTLMHAMIAISILVEVGAVLTGILVGFSGKDNIAIAQATGYAICAVVVSIGTSMFLSNRDVSPAEIWNWPIETDFAERLEAWWQRTIARRGASLLFLLMGAAGGLALGLFAHGYMHLLQYFPATEELIRKSQEQMAKVPNLRISYMVMAVGFAPFAEEYLFRGLLYRALDREWGGWRALVGSAAFFAIYHPPLAWVPVGLLGLTNAYLFKKTGRLAPAVILHMVYNAVVLS